VSLQEDIATAPLLHNGLAYKCISALEATLVYNNFHSKLL